jgi:hypothetical protein
MKSSKYIPPSLRKNEKKKFSLNDFPTLGNEKFSLNDFPTLGNIPYKPTTPVKTEMSYKEKLEKINKINNVNDELPEGWIRLSTYKPTPKEDKYPDLTPTEEFIMIMDICSKNRANYYKSRLLEPPDIYVSPPEYEDVEEVESSESDLDMEDPEYEKIMSRFDK